MADAIGKRRRIQLIMAMSLPLGIHYVLKISLMDLLDEWLSQPTPTVASDARG